MANAHQRHTAAPHTYYLTVRTALDQPIFADTAHRNDYLDLLETVRQVFDAHLFSWRLDPDQAHLILRHGSPNLDTEQRLRERWALLGSRSHLPFERLEQRLTNTGALMQTLSQRFSRTYHKRHGSSGHLWAGRYRSCLLADDAAVLATASWLERDHICSARLERDTPASTAPQLASLPLRMLPGGMTVPADEAQLGFPPPAPDDEAEVFALFRDDLDQDSLSAYAHALDHGWALGRPESLTESLDQLGRSTGRGRSRSVRELDDQLGLCGLWG